MTTEKHLIIGAGIVGLGYAQSLKAANIPYDQIDARASVGGIWYDGVYDSVRIIAPKEVTQYFEYPMPDVYPQFPGKKEMGAYLKQYADHFKLHENLELQRKVLSVHPVENNRWEVLLDGQERRVYKGVIIAAGRHWSPRLPEYEGFFLNEHFHSKQYKKQEQLKAERVCIVGAGNSGCDIANDAIKVGAKYVAISIRNPILLLPKTFLGIPLSKIPLRNYAPGWLKELSVHIISRLSGGAKDKLLKPKKSNTQNRKTINAEALDNIKAGRVRLKPKISKLNGTKIVFEDGTEEAFDLLIYATGYTLNYPFLPAELNRIEGDVLKVYGLHFLSDYEGLYFAGWTEPARIGNVTSANAKLFAEYIKLQEKIQVPIGAILAEMGEELPTSHYLNPDDRIADVESQLKAFRIFAEQVEQLADKYPIHQNKVIEPAEEVRDIEVN